MSPPTYAFDPSRVAIRQAFSIAVEHTLTEAFQGRDIDHASSTNHLARPLEAQTYKNQQSIWVNNLGAFPATPFTDEPTWEPSPWPTCDDSDNRDMLRHMFGLLRRDGRHVLVRDASHLGFPSAFIIVPGMSTIDVPADGLMSTVRDKALAKAAFMHVPSFTPEELEAVLRLEPKDASTQFPSQLTQPLSRTKMHPARFYGFIHLARGEFAQAWWYFESLEGIVRAMARIYWRAMAVYANQRENGLDRTRALRVVSFLNIDAVTSRVERDAIAADEDLNRLFPRMSCYDCDHCELGAAGGCRGTRASRTAYATAARALLRSEVSQEALLERLKPPLALRPYRQSRSRRRTTDGVKKLGGRQESWDKGGLFRLYGRAHRHAVKVRLTTTEEETMGNTSRDKSQATDLDEFMDYAGNKTSELNDERLGELAGGADT